MTAAELDELARRITAAAPLDPRAFAVPVVEWIAGRAAR